ncbi:uncharacterized protein LOC115697478 isoform X1 [Cannabis sativa]|uniref:uncharacterized protein LOC115697478 isoform X1 n=1 Tax=Cannabis sativa TaxID=3483 RepID=UPI0029C9D452|nr:uncharacterized protein LOC115697478 isoform X1 [Cannabis sativa]
MMMSLSVSRLPNPRPSLLPSSMARVSHSHSLRNSNFCSRPLCRPRVLLPPASARTTSPALYTQPDSKAQVFEENIEKVIYRCRFMALLGVLGSLIGSILCFIKGCAYVVQSFVEYIVNHGKVIMLLVEAIDVYLLGTVMLVFGMGLYELFVSNLGTAKSLTEEKGPYASNLFGLFTLKVSFELLLGCFGLVTAYRSLSCIIYFFSWVINVYELYLTGTTEVVGYKNSERAENKGWTCNCYASSNRFA